MRSRDERIERLGELAHLGHSALAERVVDLEDEVKKLENMLNRLGEAYAYEPSQESFNDSVFAILEERNRD